MKHLLGVLAAAVVAVGSAVAVAGQSAPAPASTGDAAEQRSEPPSSQLVADLRAALEAAGWDAERWGVMVVSLATGETLFAHNADRPLTPASNMKLFTTAAALHYLGPEYRYQTYVTALGQVRDGVVEGDLLLYGTGDPTVADRFHETKLTVWEALADSLSALGIRRIRGDVIGDASYFDGRPVGVGWDTTYITHTYAALASALSFNENIVTLRITGGPADGEPARVQFIPAGRVELVNRTTTGGTGRLRVRRADYTAPVELDGGVPRGGSGLWRAVPVPDPAAFAASAFAEVLESRGIEVDGVTRSIQEPERSPVTGRRVFAPTYDGDAVQVMVVHQSPPLREILQVINQRSHNLYAESVIRSVGRVATGSGSVEGGAAALAEMLEGAGLEPGEVRIDDGSGLSSLNRATPHSIIRLMAHMQDSPHWAEYWETLPEAAVSRGLRRMQETDAAGNLRAKTGTINRVSALSGYVRARNGEVLAFSIISNDVPSTFRAKRVEDRIGARLASFDRAVPSGAQVAAAAPPAEDPAESVEPTTPAGEAGEGEAAEVESRTYVIRRGDTLEGIARREGVTLSALREANPDVNPRRLIPGRSLEIPGAR